MILIIILAFIMEVIDSSMGMMYGTILSPLLLGFGYSPKDVVPALVLSQAMGGVVASFGHQGFGNASFRRNSKDLKVSFIIFSLGIVAVIAGVFLGVKVDKMFLSIYISVLMLIMGVVTMFGFRLKFRWMNILTIGVISSFNKALSGGGFGPIVTTGQAITGRSGRRSVGTTTMSEVGICAASFIAWVVISHRLPDLKIMVALCIGAVLGGVMGPCLLSKIPNNKWFVRILGFFAIVSGTFALIEILI